MYFHLIKNNKVLQGQESKQNDISATDHGHYEYQFHIIDALSVTDYS